MAQPKPSSAKVSMPTFSTLEAWTRSQVQELMQSVLEEEVTHALGGARYQRQGLLDAPSGYRKGHGKPRKLSFTSGTIEVKRPRVRGLEERFESAILPLFARCTQEVGQLLPELYLHGLSQGATSSWRCVVCWARERRCRRLRSRVCGTRGSSNTTPDARDGWTTASWCTPGRTASCATRRQRTGWDARTHQRAVAAAR